MPTPSEVHVDSALSTFISSYENGRYFADRVSPIIETPHRSDKYQKFDRKDATTARDDLLPAQGEANQADYLISTGSFSVVDRGLVGYVTASEMQNADDPHRPFEKRSRFLMNALQLGREIRVANQLTTTGNYASGNTAAAGNYWTDETVGTPLDDLHTMRAALAPGLDDETDVVLALSLESWQALSKHPQMFGGGAVNAKLSMQEVASMLGLAEILVSDAQKNTANIDATASYSRIWGKDAVMLRVPRGEPSDETGLFAATFRYALGGPGVTVRTWDAPWIGRGATAVQVEFSDDEVVVQNDMGYLLTDVIA